jgi:hypothetical protein
MGKQVTTTVAGAVLVAAAVAAGVAAAVPGKVETPDGAVRFGWNVLPTIWPLVAALAVAGVVLARGAAQRPAAAVAAVLGAQVAGIGVVAVRDWFDADGASGIAQRDLATVVTFAAAVAVAGTAATCVAAALLWREPARGWAAWRPRRPALLAAGAVVVVLLPPAVGYAAHDADLTSLGQYALIWSLPWGGGLAAAAWLGPRASRAATRAVAASAALTAAGILLLVSS